MVAFKSDWSYAGPWKALVCAYQKPLWFKTKRICCKQNFLSLSRRNTVCGIKRGCDFNRQPPHLYVVSSFGLCAGLLRQQKFAPDCFVRSEKFASVVDTLNGIDLDCDSPSSFGGKSFPSDHGTKEMEMLKSKSSELESEIKELEKNNKNLDSFLLTSQPLAASSPSQSSSNSSSSSAGSSSSFIEETLNSALEPINRKRAVAKHCKEVTADLDGVCEKYHETLACVLGNSIIYGGEEEKEKVSNDI